MTTHQPGILAPVPKQALYLFFAAKATRDVKPALRFLATKVDGDQVVLGLGASVVQALGVCLPGLKNFQAPTGSKVDIPATPFDLMLWLRGSDRGDLLHLSRTLEMGVAEAFECVERVDAFKHQDGRDLSGYVDGTENPKGKKAQTTGFVTDAKSGLQGSSFLAVQRWQHDFATLDGMSSKERDNSIGRRHKDNEEIAKAPESAHVKRTAQENFAPEAFVLRRSMPWSDGNHAGLLFTAFGKSFEAFEAQIKRMSGAEDGIVDALFRFTKPMSTAYFWCPPRQGGKVDLRKLLR